MHIKIVMDYYCMCQELYSRHTQQQTLMVVAHDFLFLLSYFIAIILHFMFIIIFERHIKVCVCTKTMQPQTCDHILQMFRWWWWRANNYYVLQTLPSEDGIYRIIEEYIHI